jgi:hypothetical protein
LCCTFMQVHFSSRDTTTCISVHRHPLRPNSEHEQRRERRAGTVVRHDGAVS